MYAKSMINPAKLPPDEKSIIALEAMSLNAWPAVKTLYRQGCILRFSNGYTKRSNSVNALYRYGGLDELIDYSETVYGKNGLPAIFKIIDCPAYSELDSALKDRGYEVLDRTTVKTIDLSGTDFPLHQEVSVRDAFTDEWMESFIDANHLEPKRETVRRVLESIVVEKLVASIKKDGRTIGFGFGAVEDGCVGFFDIFIRQEHRGAGYGKKMMNTLLGAAKRGGARYGYLQVMDHNAPAIKLYEALGFSSSYKYWYRVPG